MKNHRFLFAGFRHPHISGLYDRVSAHPDCAIAGAWEGDGATRRQLAAEGRIDLTHEDFATMLAEGGGTVVAIGDTYGRRGALAIAALQAGCHVISDKPLCTRREELETIAELAREKGLSVGCQLDLTEAPVLRRLRGLVRRGTLGKVQTVTVLAQHPLRYGSRPGWYFEPGEHGGTLNDIGVHVFDLLPWLTGSPWRRILTARDWNAKATEAPHFRDCAQLHGVLENGAACFADVSYLAPDRSGYSQNQYWRITVHGTAGMAEASYGAETLMVVTDADESARDVTTSSVPDGERDCLQNFLDEIEGKGTGGIEKLTTENILKTSRLALEAQQRAASES
ncbi:putative dehydrogenase [Opitutaceae bacterium TAV1]|nr:putative dehydrogenase [Opitutaceae bacterium TAV1]